MGVTGTHVVRRNETLTLAPVNSSTALDVVADGEVIGRLFASESVDGTSSEQDRLFSLPAFQEITT